MSPKAVKLEVWYSEADNPFDEDGWKLYSFNSRHINYRDPYSLIHTKDGEIRANSIGLQRKLNVGTAFIVSCYEHSGRLWGLQGEVFQCRWDTAQVAGILIWEDEPSAMGAKTYKDRQEDARKMLSIFNDWGNGQNFGYCVEYDNEETRSCGGYIGIDDLVADLREECPDIFAENKKLKEGIELSGEAADSIRSEIL